MRMDSLRLEIKAGGLQILRKRHKLEPLMVFLRPLKVWRASQERAEGPSEISCRGGWSWCQMAFSLEPLRSLAGRGCWFELRVDPDRW